MSTKLSAAPAAVKWAFFTILAAAGVFIILTLLQIIRSYHADALPFMRDGTNIADADIESVSSIYRVGLIVWSFVLVGLYLLLAFLIRRGSKPSRWAIAVLAAVSTIGLLTAEPLTCLWVSLNTFSALLLFTASSQQFFLRSSSDKKQTRQAETQKLSDHVRT